MSGRHAFASRFLDWPSLQPERVPARRAPKHRYPTWIDACSLTCEAGDEGGGTCDTYVGKHRAEVAA